MKNLFILFVVGLCVLTSSTPIERTTLDVLTSYKWSINKDTLTKFIDPEYPDDAYPVEVYIMFTDTLCYILERWSDDPENLTPDVYRFYLENQIESNASEFDASKVGKNKNGIYIFQEGMLEVTILRIEELTENRLITFPVETFGGNKIVWEAHPKN